MKPLIIVGEFSFERHRNYSISVGTLTMSYLNFITKFSRAMMTRWWTSPEGQLLNACRYTSSKCYRAGWSISTCRVDCRTPKTIFQQIQTASLFHCLKIHPQGSLEKLTSGRRRQRRGGGGGGACEFGCRSVRRRPPINAANMFPWSLCIFFKKVHPPSGL